MPGTELLPLGSRIYLETKFITTHILKILVVYLLAKYVVLGMYTTICNYVV